MTRRKKSKSAVNRNAVAEVAMPSNNVAGSFEQTNEILNGPRPVHGATGPLPVYASTGPRPVYAPTCPRGVHAPSGPRPVYASSGPRPVYAPSGPRPVYASSTSSNRSEIADSVLSAASTSTWNSDKISTKKSKPKQVTVRYETKEIYIQPRYPILTVERLKNLDYHVGVLTEALGKKPRVYQHGRNVRFVPETNEEYKTMQRYLAKVESQEGVAWCSYTLPPGNSLKVSIKVRIVERVKIEEHLQKLKLDDNAKSAEMKQMDSRSHNAELFTSTTGTRGTKQTQQFPKDKRASNTGVSGGNENFIKHLNGDVKNVLSTSTSAPKGTKPIEQNATDKSVSKTGVLGSNENNKHPNGDVKIVSSTSNPVPKDIRQRRDRRTVRV